MAPGRPSKKTGESRSVQALLDLNAVHHGLIVRAVGESNDNLTVDGCNVGEALNNCREVRISGSRKDIKVRQHLCSIDRNIELSRIRRCEEEFSEVEDHRVGSGG